MNSFKGSYFGYNLLKKSVFVYMKNQSVAKESKKR